jgi:hypothetical protein
VGIAVEVGLGEDGQLLGLCHVGVVWSEVGIWRVKGRRRRRREWWLGHA